MARPKLTLFLDVISPFAYMAFHITKNHPTFAQCDVTYIPVFLGGIMQACGNTPPMKIKNKDKWSAAERQRWAQRFHVPFGERVPTPFPQPTLNPQRALCAVQLRHPELLPACFEALFEAFWMRGDTIGNVEVFGQALEGVLGREEAGVVLGMLGSAEAKDLLKANTELAMEEGAFGLPWFVATNAKGEKEGIWGVDHMDELVDFLGIERQGKGFRAML